MLATSTPSAFSKLLRAYVFNPDFEAVFTPAQQIYVEELLGENHSGTLVTKDATPVAFVVPDGCDSVDILYGPIEVNPGCGCDADLEDVVLVGDAKLSANVEGIDGLLVPGAQFIVTVPWRAASWVDLPAGRLRLQVFANFYKSMST